MQEIYRKLLREAEERDDPRGMCRILLEMGRHLALGNEAAPALGCFQRALALAVALEDPALEERALEPLGLVFLHLGGADEAAACFQRLVEIVRGVGDRDKEARLLGFLGALDLKRDRLGEATVRLTRAAELLRAGRDAYGYYAVLKLRAETARRRGDPAAAARLLEEGLRMAGRADPLHEVNDLLGELAEVHLARGALGPARHRLLQGLRVARALDDIPEEAIYLVRLSDLDRKAGDPLAALLKVRSAFDLVVRLGVPELVARTFTLLGLILERQGRERAARAALARAVQQARAAGRGDAEAEALIAYAWLLLRARDPGIRDPRLAIRAATRAGERAEHETAAPQFILSKAYRMLGDRRRGREALLMAQRIAKK